MIRSEEASRVGCLSSQVKKVFQRRGSYPAALSDDGSCCPASVPSASCTPGDEDGLSEATLPGAQAAGLVDVLLPHSWAYQSP